MVCGVGGRAQVTPGGFGCAYTVKDGTVQFNVVSKGLDSEGMGAELLASLSDLQGQSTIPYHTMPYPPHSWRALVPCKGAPVDWACAAAL